MKKILFVIFMLYLTIAGAFAQEQTTVSQFQGQKITEIEAHGVFSIIVRQGTSTGVTVNIPARFEKQLVLRLNPDGNCKSISKGRSRVKIEETMMKTNSRQKSPLPPSIRSS